MEKVISSKIVFECPIFKVEEAVVELKDGTHSKRWYVVKRDAVFTIPVIKGNRILMLKEYRSASQTIEWRIPAGGVEVGEDIKLAAIREMREETGLEPLDIKFYKTFRNPSSTIKQNIHAFIATQFRENPLDTGDKEEEDIKVIEVGLQELEKLLKEGAFTGSIQKALQMFISEKL